jgi:hypothetical protein
MPASPHERRPGFDFLHGHRGYGYAPRVFHLVDSRSYLVYDSPRLPEEYGKLTFPSKRSLS